MTAIRKMYKYRLYQSARREARLHRQIDVAGSIWNHITALRRRYYRLTGKYLSEKRLKAHIAKLRRQSPRYWHWKLLGAQAVQDVIERHGRAFARFFKKEGGPPKFRKIRNYKSFTLKQAGWKLAAATPDKQYRSIKIGKTRYKFVYHRPLQGQIKTVTIKRDAAHRLWLYFSVVEKVETPNKASTGKTGGFDFGLKHFLTTDEGQVIEMPQYFKADLPHLRQVKSRVDKKQRGSKNRRAGGRYRARREIRIADKRRDFHYQLAHELCDVYDTLVFETLNIKAMKQLWGRKVSDLAFAQFIGILQWVASKRGKQVVFIDRWERTTGKCSHCGHKQKLELEDRVFDCHDCGFTLDRDHNAARNIVEAGRRLILSQSS